MRLVHLAFLFSGLSSASFGATGAVTGAAPTASVDFASGQVQVVSNGAATDAKKGQTLTQGETLRTGKDSAAILLMSDGSRIKLNPETELGIGSAEKGKTELALQSGAVFSKVAKQGAQGRFLIRTKTATMGVRGTEFYTAYGKQSKAGADVWMCVHEGKVEVEANSKDAKKVLVNQGEGVFVPVGKDVTPPKKYGWTKTLNWNMNPDSGELIDRTHIDYSDLLKQDYD